MNILRFTIDGSATAQDCSVWFALPPGFIVLGLDALAPKPEAPAPTEEVLHRLRRLHHLLPGPAARQRFLGALVAAQQFAVMLSQVGTVHCSLGMHRDDDGDGQPLLSVFTLGWQDTAWAPRRVTAARAVSDTPGTRLIELLDLPCGPASLSEICITSPSEVDPQHRRLLQISAHIPHPDGVRLAVLTLSTTATHQSDHYSEMLRQIAHMVSFDDPFSPEVQR